MATADTLRDNVTRAGRRLHLDVLGTEGVASGAARSMHHAARTSERTPAA